MTDTLGHILRGKVREAPLISTSAALRDYLWITMAGRPVETVCVLYFDAGNRLLQDEIVYTGSAHSVTIEPREIIRRSIELGASALIIVHNHPSGDPTPSSADKQMTCRLAAAAKSLDIRVIDHIVVASEGWTSFREKNLL